MSIYTALLLFLVYFLLSSTDKHYDKYLCTGIIRGNVYVLSDLKPPFEAKIETDSVSKTISLLQMKWRTQFIKQVTDILLLYVFNPFYGLLNDAMSDIEVIFCRNFLRSLTTNSQPYYKAGYMWMTICDWYQIHNCEWYDRWRSRPILTFLSL